VSVEVYIVVLSSTVYADKFTHITTM